MNQYTVTFVDEDGTTVLQAAALYDYGTAAADIVKPADPTKDPTDEKVYTFAGWTDGTTTYVPGDTLPEVTGEVTYVDAGYNIVSMTGLEEPTGEPAAE